MIMKLKILMFTLILCAGVKADQMPVPPLFADWEVVVFIEKSDSGKPVFTVIKNTGEHPIVAEDIEKWNDAFAAKVAKLNNEVILYAMTFKNGKKLAILPI